MKHHDVSKRKTKWYTLIMRSSSNYHDVNLYFSHEGFWVSSFCIFSTDHSLGMNTGDCTKWYTVTVPNVCLIYFFRLVHSEEKSDANGWNNSHAEIIFIILFDYLRQSTPFWLILFKVFLSEQIFVCYAFYVQFKLYVHSMRDTLTFVHKDDTSSFIYHGL